MAIFRYRPLLPWSRLRPNTLLTRYPIAFVSLGPRQIFNFRDELYALRRHAGAHGYQVCSANVVGGKIVGQHRDATIDVFASLHFVVSAEAVKHIDLDFAEKLIQAKSITVVSPSELHLDYGPHLKDSAIHVLRLNSAAGRDMFLDHCIFLAEEDLKKSE